MADLTLRNVPEALMERIRQRAVENGRSLDSEAIVLLEEGLGSKPRPTADELIARARALREQYNLPPLTQEFLDEAKNEGRK